MTCKHSRIISVMLIIASIMVAGTVTAVEEIMIGDADNDGKVTIKDVTCIQRAIANLPAGSNFSKFAADVDRNGTIDISDAAFVQKWLVHIETPYQIGEKATEPSTQVTETLTQTSETSTNTTKTTTQSTQTSTQPTQTTTQPTQTSTQPTQASTIPTETTTQPTGTTQRQTDPDGWGRDIFRP